MAEDSWPKSTRNGGTINDYEHEQLVAPSQMDGLIGVPSDPALVYGDSTGMQIKVRPNRYGLVRAKEWYSGPAEFTKNIAANSSGATRIDLVVLRWDRSNNSVSVQIRQGTPGLARPAPVQQTPPVTAFGTGIWELPIAQVTVVNNAATITTGDVVNLAWYIAPDGKILCTSVTRPYGGTLYSGLEIYETDTTVFRAYDGVGWPMSRSWRRNIQVTATVASVTFSNIPSTFRKLAISGTARANNAAIYCDVFVQINGISTVSYRSSRFGAQNGNSFALTDLNANGAQIGTIAGNSAAVGVFGEFDAVISGWDNPHATYLTLGGRGGVVDVGGSVIVRCTSAAAVAGPYTSVTILLTSPAQWLAGSEFVLIGYE